MSASALLAACLLGAIALGVHLLDRYLREGGPAGQRKVQAARWASRRELKPLRVDGPQPGRLVLGRQGRHLIAAEPRASVIVVGPSRTSFKTSGFAIPSLLEWQGPAVATSVKSDLLLHTRKRREELGEVMVFDPTGVTGGDSVKATPLSGCGDWRGALRVAHRLASAGRAGGSDGLQDADFWYAAAEKLLAPMLYVAETRGGSMAEVIRWLNEGTAANEELSKRIATTEKSEEALAAWNANMRREPRQRSSIYTTAETILAAFADPRVLEASSDSGYTPASLLGKANTLYLCAPAHEQERLRTLFAAMVTELVSTVYESSAKTGKPIDPPLLIVLDEAANIAPVPDLDGLASTGAGQGIQLVTVFQDLAQVQARYGKRAQTIINNHRAKVFASGTADPNTLRYISDVVGDAEFSQRSETAVEKGRNSATEGNTYRKLAPANVVRGAKPGSALLVYGHLGAARIALRPWFEQGTLRDPRITSQR